MPNRVVEEIHHSKRGRDVLTDPFQEKNSCSQLTLLSEAPHEAGVRRIESDLHAAETRGDTLVFAADIGLSMLTAGKP